MLGLEFQHPPRTTRFFPGKAVVMIIGAVLLIVGVVQIVSGLRSEGWSSKLPPLILGIIAALCGLGLLGEPWIGMKFITLLLAIFFVLEGIWKIREIRPRLRTWNHVSPPRPRIAVRAHSVWLYGEYNIRGTVCSNVCTYGSVGAPGR
jgi:hypothetical protein